MVDGDRLGYLKEPDELEPVEPLGTRLIDEGRILEARRKRVRNALVHGNPSHFDVVASVRSYSEFLSSRALRAGLES